MKELSIEEKAKRYDEAIEKIQKYVKDDYGCTRLRPEDIFPELKNKDEMIRKALIKYFSEGMEYLSLIPYSKKQCIAWLEKQGEQKPAEWSEIDQNNIGTLKSIVYNDCNAEDASRLIIWLNSLKDRVQSQPSQEWSEEDEIARNALINLVEMYYGGCIDKSEKNRLLSWLKSLRPQNTWKPSDEQMNALKEAVDEHFDIDGGALWHLYEDLKKLKGE